jgi:hypothetical protein
MDDPVRPDVSRDKAPVVPRWQRAAHDDSLQRMTLAWFKGLPEPIRPVQCARLHPRVLNDIAALWRLPARCAVLLDELLADDRGERRGFSDGVTQELRRLQAYLQALSESGGDTPLSPEV